MTMLTSITAIIMVVVVVMVMILCFFCQLILTLGVGFFVCINLHFKHCSGHSSDSRHREERWVRDPRRCTLLCHMTTQTSDAPQVHPVV